MTRIEALRQIVATNKAAKLDGHVVDTFTASRLLESYKALDGAGRRRFASMSVDKMVTAGPINDVMDGFQSYGFEKSAPTTYKKQTPFGVCTADLVSMKNRTVKVTVGDLSFTISPVGAKSDGEVASKVMYKLRLELNDMVKKVTDTKY